MRTTKIFLAMLAMAVLFFSCNKVEDDGVISDGTITLTDADLVAGGYYYSRTPTEDYWIIESEDYNLIYDKVLAHLKQIYSEDETRRITLDFTPSTCTSLPSSAFSAAYALERFIGSESITTLGQYVFVNCLNLTEASLPGVTTSSYYAFRYCSALESVYLPSLKSVNRLFFQNCTALTFLNLSCATGVTHAADNCKPGEANDSFSGVTTENIEVWLSSANDIVGDTWLSRTWKDCKPVR